MFTTLLLILILLAFYFLVKKLNYAHTYWKQKKIFYVPFYTGLIKLFTTKGPFINLLKENYRKYSSYRYYGDYQILTPILSVRDHDLIKQITIKDFDHFTDHVDMVAVEDLNEPIFGMNLFSLRGPQWRQMRSTLSPAFTSSKMRHMYSLIRETAEHYSNHFIAKNEPIIAIEARRLVEQYATDVIANCAFGISVDSLAEPTNEFFKMGKLINSPSSWTMCKNIVYFLFPKLMKRLGVRLFSDELIDFFRGIVQGSVASRQSTGLVRPDMIHLLMEARKGRLIRQETSREVSEGFAIVEETPVHDSPKLEITDDVMTAQALIFFIAGFGPVSLTLSYLQYSLAIHPDVQAKLHEEIINAGADNVTYEKITQMKYLDQFVSETLRMWTVAAVIMRTCVKDYLIEAKQANEVDFVVKKGDVVALPTLPIHFDPEFYPDPEKFEPERFSDENKGKIVAGTYLPFGAGPRNCIGSRFAILEMKAFVVALVSRFELVVTEKTEIPLKLTKMTMEPKNGVHIGLKKRLAV